MTCTKAYPQGFYVGIDAGYSNSGYSAKDVLPSSASVEQEVNSNINRIRGKTFNTIIGPITLLNVDSQLKTTTEKIINEIPNYISGRFFIGYNLNKHFATEWGYNYLTNAHAIVVVDTAGYINLTIATVYPPPINYINISLPATADIIFNEKFNEQALDFSFKTVINPFNNDKNQVYYNLGAAYISANFSNDLNIRVNAPYFPPQQAFVSVKQKQTGIFPLVSLGGQHHLTSKLSFGINWTHIASNQTLIRAINFYSINLVYSS